MRVTKSNVTPICGFCERTLLMGEQTLRFSADGQSFVDVCPLCQGVALDHGWVREGHAVSPALHATGRRRKQRRCGRRSSARGRKSPSPSCRSRSCAACPTTSSRSSRPPISQPERLQANDCGCCQEPRGATGIDRPVARCQRRDRAHLCLGHHLVPVPRLAGGSATRQDRGARARHGRADCAVHQVDARLDEQGRLLPALATV